MLILIFLVVMLSLQQDGQRAFALAARASVAGMVGGAIGHWEVCSPCWSLAQRLSPPGSWPSSYLAEHMSVILVNSCSVQLLFPFRLPMLFNNSLCGGALWTSLCSISVMEKCFGFFKKVLFIAILFFKKKLHRTLNLNAWDFFLSVVLKTFLPPLWKGKSPWSSRRVYHF